MAGHVTNYESSNESLPDSHYLGGARAAWECTALRACVSRGAKLLGITVLFAPVSQFIPFCSGQ